MDKQCSRLPFRQRQSFKPVTVRMNQLFNCFVYTLCYVTAKQSLIINIPTPPVPMRPAFTAHSLLPTPAPFFIPFADAAKRVTGELEFLSKQSWETEMCSDTAFMPKVWNGGGGSCIFQCARALCVTVTVFTQVVNMLRSQITKLDEIKKERETLEGEIKAVTFDMSVSFLTALARDGAINEEQLSSTQLEQLYGAYNQRVQASLRTQEELLGQVQTSHQEFSNLKQSNAESNQREEVLKKLASAHDSYVEISNNLREGTKFYNDLTEILLKFQNKCSDIVFARKTERDELLKELQQSIAREPSAPSFNVPAYQSTPAPPAAGPTPAPRTVFAEQQPPAKPPARPPPPTFTPHAASSTPANAAPASTPPNNPPPVAPPTQAQGPPYPSYQGYPGYYQMPMGYNPYAYGQYNMPYMSYQATPGQAGYPGAPPAGQPYPGYPQHPPQQQPYYPQQ
ncbi:hypothetical protein fugu_018241 [Takifugu bimaculatus]|uniref:ALIX V-shaped domain-containing protein n=1 Tax=Takifugu bimaculatus TaxID=433685 RepID=A0A4Z2BLE0_9TELE|nr:hypothetical protein fugu_018241 [Takifugu bimaculatus]